MEKIDLVKQIRGVNTYRNVIDTQFKEFIQATSITEIPTYTVSDFFNLYDSLFYDIPLTGNNSHTTLVQKSMEYIGGDVIDEEKQALIEEINTLKQQLIDLSETYLKVGDITA